MTVAMAISPLMTMLALVAFLHGTVPLVSAQVFASEPRDAEILIDTQAIMRCEITNQPGAFVYWSVPANPAQSLGPNKDLPDGTDSRFSVQGEEGSGVFDLVISRVQPEDDGQYICLVVLDEGRGEMFRSEPATLTVVQVPTATGNPVCWIREGRVASVGDSLSLRCASSDPDVDLMWYLGDVAISHSVLDIPSGTGIDSDFLAESSANQQTFTCQPNNIQYTACDVTLEVRHQPIVTIKEDGVIETGQDARFICEATGNPSNFAYIWHYSDYQISFEEHPRFNRARLEQSGSVLVLPGLTDSDVNVTLRCEAVNSIGAATATHVIKAQAGRTLAQIIGPILLGVILGLVLIVLVLYGIWWRRQRRKVKQISKRKSVKRSSSRREEVPTVDSGIVYTQTLGGFGSRYGKKSTSNGDLARSGLDLESAGYGPDVTSIPAYRATAEEEREDDGALRPIPRKKSTSSMSSLVNGGKQLASTSADDAALITPQEEKSFTYYVNPHFDDLRIQALKENNLDPETEDPPSYNIEQDPLESNLANEDNVDDNIVSTEL